MLSDSSKSFCVKSSMRGHVPCPVTWSALLVETQYYAWKEDSFSSAGILVFSGFVTILSQLRESDLHE